MEAMKDVETFSEVEQEILEGLRKLLPFMTPEQRLRGLSPEERLQGLRPEERLQGLHPEERLQGLQRKELEQLKRMLEKKLSEEP